MTTATEFDTTWNALADLGKCDSLGGAEYRRVLREWAIDGYTENVADFIVRRANVGLDKVAAKDTPTSHLRNALQIIVGRRDEQLDAADVRGIEDRIRAALAQLEGEPTGYPGGIVDHKKQSAAAVDGQKTRRAK